MRKITWQLCFILLSRFCLGHAYEYITYSLLNPNLCSVADLKSGKIKLEQNRFAAAKLLSPRRPIFNFSCTFKVKTINKSDGVIAVIQELAFRKNESTGRCIDYIEFTFDDGKKSKQFCGSYNAELKMDEFFFEESLYDDSFEKKVYALPVKENTVLAKEGTSLEVFVYISNKDMREDWIAIIDVIFTLYTPCQRAPRNFQACLESGNICINNKYFKDGAINCPYVGCVDEGSCRREPDYGKPSIGNKVLISSVSSLVISFCVFILCVYLCRKYKKFCWSEQFASPQDTQENQVPRVIEMQEQSSQPSDTQAARVEAEDKDLPPSYDSLFPNR